MKAILWASACALAFAAPAHAAEIFAELDFYSVDGEPTAATRLSFSAEFEEPLTPLAPYDFYDGTLTSAAFNGVAFGDASLVRFYRAGDTIVLWGRAENGSGDTLWWDFLFDRTDFTLSSLGPTFVDMQDEQGGWLRYGDPQIVSLSVDPAILDVPSRPGVPEPATWAMMIGGFALAGAALRRRRYSVGIA